MGDSPHRFTMESQNNQESQFLCPSAQPDLPDAVIFGVVSGSADQPRVEYLAEARPVTNELLSLSGPVNATEVFRSAAPCAQSSCKHFTGSKCQLATRIVHILPSVSNDVPSCRLRPRCRWWRQEGKAACLRCTQIVTEVWNPSEELRQAAGSS